MVAILYCFLNGEVSVLGNPGIPMQELPGEQWKGDGKGAGAGLLAWQSPGDMINYILGNVPRIEPAEIDSVGVSWTCEVFLTKLAGCFLSMGKQAQQTQKRPGPPQKPSSWQFCRWLYE